MTGRIFLLFISCMLAGACKKNSEPPAPEFYSFIGATVDGKGGEFDFRHIDPDPEIQLTFSSAIDISTVNTAVSLRQDGGAMVPLNAELSNNDKTLSLKPASSLKGFTRYILTVSGNLLARGGSRLEAPLSIAITTSYDNRDKFPRLTDDELLTQVQRQTLRYFRDLAHPASGMARERNSSGDLVTTGGTGFGIMALIVGIERQFISHSEGLEQVERIVDFLSTKADRFKGAFPHWLNGNTGAVIPFSDVDNGADLVETALLMQGLITARQYFDGASPAETTLREHINELYAAVDWNFFRQNDEQVLYWHWSPDRGFALNLKIQGWNETLITYILAAASPTHPIPRSVYEQGYARNGSMRNGNQYYGITLPLGPQLGGPLFFAHYSFLGLDPRNLSDAYANYWTQNTAHSRINYEYAKADPGNFGYTDSLWGLTASDNNGGYSAHSPTNDLGVITPSAALSSFPYTPDESMAALHTFYYKLGDKLWGQYGFRDAFNLSQGWFAESWLAIDQGPIIIMIENYRTGLLWNLFMEAPEVKKGLDNLGFSY